MQVRQLTAGDGFEARNEPQIIVGLGAAEKADSVEVLSAGEYPAIVRFSRSVGLPRPLPDLLMVTSVDLPVAHHVFVPAGDVQARAYSSSLPFQAGDERFLVGALPRPESPRPSGEDDARRQDAADAAA